MTTRRKRLRVRLAGLAALGIVIWGCSQVPISGRNQLNLVSDSQLMSLSEQQYRQFMATHPKSKDAEATARVQRVGQRIQAAVERYAREHNRMRDLEGYEWEFNLIEDNKMNAWCMPGGKVAFYTGILPVCQDDNGIAVVMGHEVAHAVARHGAERMSQDMLVQLGGMALGEAIKTKSATTKNIFLNAYGIGTHVGALLPFSRGMESEADHLGLVFMAMAGYNPDAAIPFWQRMAAAKQGSGTPPEFLSTHPSDANRIKRIQEWLPEARGYYRAQ